MQSNLIIRLPFRMAIPDETTYVSGFDKYDFKVIFRHWDLAITGVGWEGEALPITVAYLTTSTDIFDQSDQSEQSHYQEIVRGFFLASLDYLNRVIDSYRVATKDYTARNITLGDLPPINHIWIDEGLYLYTVHIPYWIANEIEDRSEETKMKTGDWMATWSANPELAMIERFYINARHYLEQENKFSAIIELETAFELHVRYGFRTILNTKNLSDTKRADLLKTPLRNVIEEHFSKELGGNFSYNDPGPIKDWYENLYLLRNKCVHEGLFDISGREVTRAFDSFHSAYEFIYEMLEKKGLPALAKSMIDNQIPRRELELYQEQIKERLIKSGLLPSDEGFTRREELSNDRNRHSQ